MGIEFIDIDYESNHAYVGFESFAYIGRREGIRDSDFTVVFDLDNEVVGLEIENARKYFGDSPDKRIASASYRFSNNQAVL